MLIMLFELQSVDNFVKNLIFVVPSTRKVFQFGLGAEKTGIEKCPEINDLGFCIQNSGIFVLDGEQNGDLWTVSCWGAP